MSQDNTLKIRPSILDRLIDNEPKNTVETEKDRYQIITELRESVRRDLEKLFNSRVRCLTAEERHQEAETSLINYGLPDLATVNLMNMVERLLFFREMAKIIECYEPRFKSVEITHIDNTNELDRTVRFKVDAVLHADPAPEVIIFDSMMEPISRNVNVETSHYDG